MKCVLPLCAVLLLGCDTLDLRHAGAGLAASACDASSACRRPCPQDPAPPLPENARCPPGSTLQSAAR
ncbi:hypothetical protein O4G98_15640 [Zoogloeaceae bacterium G21618-S1]|nr:hypothetical protein [Zoogloeaceae bacterium G21618-S1]